jgi:type I restriction enzyme R subunit
MSLHHESKFEDEVCEHLASQGWLYEAGDTAKYSRELALFSADVTEWIRTSQPKAWESLVKSYGSSAETQVLQRLRDSIEKRGTLDVLRHGIEIVGVKEKISMAQFRPAMSMNTDIIARYEANRLRVVRQVRYSLSNENSIDLVLFLNGIPVATVELKTDFTQRVQDAIDQYRIDREPRPKGKNKETLLCFPEGALVHFAVSSTEVYMTTQLSGISTTFLPFNKGDGHGAGNPLNPKGGYKSAYLWEVVWERHSWLEILGRYMVASRDAKKQIKRYIFPRYHQLDVTRKLQQAILEEGVGTPYLVQHSAGSGKTNSIAWTAHFLSDLHDGNDNKVFDTVLVISDRNVIDKQLQDAIFDFQRTTGVVAVIQGEHSSKSGELVEALNGDKKIVVCTIQTFPAAMKKVQELATKDGKRFAVIADEAHSSQTGESASKLKQLLSAEELVELADGGEVSTEDILNQKMSIQAETKGITYIAFTATPKGKTLELFGRRPDPSKPPSKDNKPVAFHVYSMRQAIEEGFILDVLQNYTTYKLAFKLAHNGVEYDETQVERAAALKGIMGWVRLHPYNISQKVEIVVEHFREKVAPLLDGKAKAMVVVSSRIDAVRWQLAIKKYIKSRGYTMDALVAFSGEVNDPESGPEPFTETNKTLNNDLHGRSIPEAFATEEYQILLVANKYQTGFDQPLLCGMYVDKRLAGIQAVQTLSRLNRAHPGKDTTFVLDFMNDTEEILQAFKTYFDVAQLSDVTDRNIVFNIKEKLDIQGHYDEFEIERVVEVELNPNSTQNQLAAAVFPVVDRLHRKYKEAQLALKDAMEKGSEAAIKSAKDTLNALLLFESDMKTYQRVYTYLSQIFNYEKTDLEKRSIFFKHVLRCLEFGREREGVDLSKVVLTHHNLKSQGRRTLNPKTGEAVLINPLTEAGAGQIQEKQRAALSEIIKKVNDLFEGELTDDDKLIYVNNVIKGKLLESEMLQQQAANNSKEQFSNSPDLVNELTIAIMNAFEAHEKMSMQALGSEKVREGLKEILLGPAGLYEALREKADKKSA